LSCFWSGAPLGLPLDPLEWVPSRFSVPTAAVVPGHRLPLATASRCPLVRQGQESCLKASFCSRRVAGVETTEPRKTSERLALITCLRREARSDVLDAQHQLGKRALSSPNSMTSSRRKLARLRSPRTRVHGLPSNHDPVLGLSTFRSAFIDRARRIISPPPRLGGAGLNDIIGSDHDRPRRRGELRVDLLHFLQLS